MRAYYNANGRASNNRRSKKVKYIKNVHLSLTSCTLDTGWDDDYVVSLASVMHFGAPVRMRYVDVPTKKNVPDVGVMYVLSTPEGKSRFVSWQEVNGRFPPGPYRETIMMCIYNGNIYFDGDHFDNTRPMEGNTTDSGGTIVGKKGSAEDFGDGRATRPPAQARVDLSITDTT
jgi:hypothetical protein